MLSPRFKKLLLVAPDIFPNQLIVDFKHVKHISNTASVFPSIFDFNPDVIIFDYDYTEKDIEKILRRIMFNKFYQDIKICCFKSSPNEKTDSFLKVLGVDYLIYREDLNKTPKNKSVLSHIGAILDASILKWAAGASVKA